MTLHVTGSNAPEQDQVLSLDGLNFLESLHRQFEPEGEALLKRRQEVQQRISKGWRPSFRDDTVDIRNSEWVIGDIPKDLMDRRHPECLLTEDVNAPVEMPRPCDEWLLQGRIESYSWWWSPPSTVLLNPRP